MCLREFLLIIAISAVLSAPPQKQITQTNTAGGGPAGVTARVQDPKCLQPKEPGPCRMNLDRFYYNAQTNACEPFKFGGCRGNDNKFGFLKTCEDACVVNKSTVNNVAAANSKAVVGPKAKATAPISTTTKSPIAAQARPQPVKLIK